MIDDFVGINDVSQGARRWRNTSRQSPNPEYLDSICRPGGPPAY
jgi:hypothetical protein